MTDKLERLVAAGIQLLPTVEITTHYVFERDGFVALVERRGDGFGGVGSAGRITEKGIAPLVLRGSSSYFVAKGFEQSATAEEVDAIRRFQSDLQFALGELSTGL